MTPRVPLSVIIAAYNEEKHIAGCVESVAWADEVIVVDGGSSDQTRSIASSAGARVLETSNAPAETQRLKGLGLARHPWFFLLDADERVSEALRDQIRAAIASPDAASAYFVLRRNHRNGRPVHMQHPDYQLRLFKKSEASSLPEKIHRIPRPSGPVAHLDGELTHFFFTTVKEFMTKLDRYTATEASYWRADQNRWRRVAFGLTLKPPARFFQIYFFKNAFRDGAFGLFYAAASAYYEWLTAARALFPGPERRS